MVTDSLFGSRRWIGLLSKVSQGSDAHAATITTAVAPSTRRGRRLNGTKIFGSISVRALRTVSDGANCATSAGSNVTLTSSPKNTPVPAIKPSSDTP